MTSLDGSNSAKLGNVDAAKTQVKAIEVRYAGAVVGRSEAVRDLDTKGVFLGLAEPLPVGTSVALRASDRPSTEEVAATVEAVFESQDLTRSGMRVRFADARAASRFGSPGDPAAEPAVAAAGGAGEPPLEAVTEESPAEAGLPSPTEGEGSGAITDDGGRIPAPDPSAFGGGGRRGRRNRRR